MGEKFLQYRVRRPTSSMLVFSICFSRGPVILSHAIVQLMTGVGICSAFTLGWLLFGRWDHSRINRD
jgi:hypothetical protein